MPVIKMPALLCDHHLLLVTLVHFCIIHSTVRGQQNSTLIFAADNNIRNCSCSTDIPDCNYNLAQLMCSCKTVLPHIIDSAVPRLSYSSDLIVWFKDASTLDLLLNFSVVHDLKLSLCVQAPLPTKYLAILGLRRLRIQSDADAQYPQQSLTIYSSNGKKTKDKLKSLQGENTLVDISYLDTALCNGYSSLKSYSVENVSNVGEHFPNLPYSSVLSMYNKSYTVTLIY